MLLTWNNVVRLESVVVPYDMQLLSAKLGLSDTVEDAERILQETLWYSVEVKHRQGNRRYKDWIIGVTGNTVTHIYFIKCLVCLDTRKIIAYNLCDSCDGGSCDKCLQIGSFRSHIPCMSC